MNILASVYACSPYDGSERAVGWNWISELDKYHNITALTSIRYKDDIEKFKSKNPNAIQNTTFVYIDVPYTSWHKGYRFERIYYIMWQKQAAKTANKLASQKKYDLIHHITYVTCVLPTYMHKVGLPFLLGPVAGGDLIPRTIDYPLNKKVKLFEFTRYISQKIFTSTPNFKRMVKNASLILTATGDTARLIPHKYKNKIDIFQAVGLQEEIFYPEPIKKDHDVPRFLMAGRMLYLKGYELGVSAFVEALNNGLKAELTILGDTENSSSMEAYKKKIIGICGKYLGKEIKVISKIEYSKMKSFYDQYDILINCSLRDSGCFVVMEAMARGLAVISLDTGGPKINTTNDTAIKIPPNQFKELVNDFAKAIIDLGTNRNRQKRLGMLARKYAIDHFSIKSRTLKMNEYYLEIMEMKNEKNLYDSAKP